MTVNVDELLQQSEQTIKALIDDGAEPSALYEIEHHLASQDFTKLEKAAVELVKEGYHVDDADEFDDQQGQRWFAFAAAVDSELDEALLAAQIRRIAEIAEECGVEYDGWGTLLDDDEESVSE
ncbi:MAG: ribonuclease E inhibitor RraB [Pseudomonadota bacterium]